MHTRVGAKAYRWSTNTLAVQTTPDILWSSSVMNMGMSRLLPKRDSACWIAGIGIYRWHDYQRRRKKEIKFLKMNGWVLWIYAHQSAESGRYNNSCHIVLISPIWTSYARKWIMRHKHTHTHTHTHAHGQADTRLAVIHELYQPISMHDDLEMSSARDLWVWVYLESRSSKESARAIAECSWLEKRPSLMPFTTHPSSLCHIGSQTSSLAFSFSSVKNPVISFWTFSSLPTERERCPSAHTKNGAC